MDDNEITVIVTGAPETIWLVYGDLERDDTHANCYRAGDVGWCDEPQYASDVRYVRADIAEAALDAAVAAALERRREYDDALLAAERERCAQHLRAAADKLAPAGRRKNAVDQHHARVLATMADELAAGI